MDIDDVPTEVTNPTQCRLGEWYYTGTGALKYKHLSDFQALEQPHKDVHQYADQALHMISAGDSQAAYAELEKMEQSSEQLLQLLCALNIAAEKEGLAMDEDMDSHGGEAELF